MGESMGVQVRSGAHLCVLCGCLGPRHALDATGRITAVRAPGCGLEIIHKRDCTQSDHLDNTVPVHNFLFPEFEMVTETEDDITPEVLQTEDESELICWERG